MKKLITLITALLISVTPLQASEVVVYDEVTGEIKQFIKSAHTPDYSARTDVIVNPDLSLLSTKETKHIKVSGGNIVSKSAAEIAAINDAEALAAAKAKEAKINNLEVEQKDMLKVLLTKIGMTEEEFKTAVKNL